MPTYVYGCPDPTHSRQEVVHKMTEDPLVPCPTCGEKMHRIPQTGGGFYQNPLDTLLDWSDRNYRLCRSKSKERFSPNRVMRPDNPLPLKSERFYHAHKQTEQHSPSPTE